MDDICTMKKSGRISLRRRASVLGLIIFLGFITLPGQAAENNYTLRIQRHERLDIIVVGHDEITSEVSVDKKGRISLPLIGLIRARGKTIKELQGAITQSLLANDIKDPLVLVEVLYHREFSIRGQIKQPGDYFHTSGMTVEMAVAIAGGFTDAANDDLVLLTRFTNSAKPPLEVKLNTQIRPGDSIEIERRLY